MARPGWLEFIESDKQEETGLGEEAIFSITLLVTMKEKKAALLKSSSALPLKLWGLWKTENSIFVQFDSKKGKIKHLGKFPPGQIDTGSKD